MKSGLLIVALAVFLSGCTGSNRGKSVVVSSEGSSPAQLHAYSATNDSSAADASKNAQSQDVIKPGDILLITFTNLPSPGSFTSFGSATSSQVKPGPVPALDQRVKDDGTITLIYNSVFQAAGKKTGDLEKEIRDYYVPKCFTDLAAAVRISPEIHLVYIDGEFRKPGRYAWTNGMRLSDAIEAAGGFTEFFNHSIKVIRSDGISQTLRLRGDWIRTNNPVLKDGDRIHNPRQLL